MGSKGFQTLLDAEREADRIVQEGRDYRIQRLKQAKAEAAAEVEALKTEREMELKRLVAEFNESAKVSMAQEEQAVHESIESIRKAFTDNRDTMVAAILKAVVPLALPVD